jgi:hypothetical protein
MNTEVCGFALEVMRDVGSALPPDVRRWLCPAESRQINPGAMPLVWVYARRLGPAGQTEGIAQRYKGTFTAGQSRRRASGGKAEATQPENSQPH